MGDLFLGCDRDGDILRRIDCLAARPSALWRWRGRFDLVADSLTRPITAFQSRTLRRDGFGSARPRDVTAIEAQVAEGLPREARIGAFDGAGATPALAALVDEMAARGVTVIPVTIPFAPPFMEALEERDPGWYAAWMEATAVLGAGAGVDIVTPGPFGSWWGDGSSTNIKHLSREGALDFTRQVWGSTGFEERLLAALPVPGRPRPSPSR
jgi:hypothetical protein